MFRITDQYFWNIVFTLFFIGLIVVAIIILDTEARLDYRELTLMDMTIMTLATWRVIRLFVCDTVTKWFREQFWNVNKVGKQLVLEKPASGPRRTIADLLSCPWCFGVWASAWVVLLYLSSEVAQYIILFLAISAVATFLQILANLVGHRAELLKRENELR